MHNCVGFSQIWSHLWWWWQHMAHFNKIWCEMGSQFTWWWCELTIFQTLGYVYICSDSHWRCATCNLLRGGPHIEWFSSNVDFPTWRECLVQIWIRDLRVKKFHVNILSVAHWLLGPHDALLCILIYVWWK